MEMQIRPVTETENQTANSTPIDMQDYSEVRIVPASNNPTPVDVNKYMDGLSTKALMQALKNIDGQIADELAKGNRRAARLLKRLRAAATPARINTGITSYTRLKRRKPAAVTAAAMIALSTVAPPAEAFDKGAIKRTLVRYGFAIPAALAGGTVGAILGAGASLAALKIATDPPVVIPVADDDKAADEKPAAEAPQK